MLRQKHLKNLKNYNDVNKKIQTISHFKEEF